MIPTHFWRIKTRLPERNGALCRVLARGKLNTCLVQFDDGVRVVTSRWAVRKIGAAMLVSGPRTQSPGVASKRVGTR